MIPQQATPIGGDPLALAWLQQVAKDADENAERLAAEASKARAVGRQHLAEADRLEAEGLAIRAAEEKIRRAILTEQASPADLRGERINDEGDIQTVLIPRITYPIARTYLTWDETPRRRCNGCLAILRDATPDEVEAANAGRDVPDVTAECPVCAPNPVIDAIFGARAARNTS